MFPKQVKTTVVEGGNIFIKCREFYLFAKFQFCVWGVTV